MKLTDRPRSLSSSTTSGAGDLTATRGIIGSNVTINRSPTTIIGAEGFLFPQKNEMWVPLVKTANAMKRDNRQTWMVIGRLKDGVTIGAARAEVRAISERLARMYPETNKGVPIFVETYTEFLWGKNSTLLYAMLWGAVSFVLLIAGANVANLMLARAVNRSREISLRMALGANRVRIIRKLLHNMTGRTCQDCCNDFRHIFGIDG